MKVALVVIGRLENRYAVEFVEYYKNLGFDHIYIIDNNHNDEEYFEDVLQEYINNDIVTTLNYRNEVGTIGSQSIQVKAYLEVYNKISQIYDWIAFFDFDEYLTLEKDNNIKEYLSRKCFNKFNQILINWRIYNDNNLIFDDGRSCIERFIIPIPKNKKICYQNNAENKHVKCIIRTKLNDLTICTPHNFLSNKFLRNKTCNNYGKKVINTSHSYLQNINYSLAYIKHFTTKTIDEFIKNKYIKGVADRNIEYFQNTYPIKRFFKYNDITKEKLEYLKQHGFDIDEINEDCVNNWFI